MQYNYENIFNKALKNTIELGLPKINFKYSDNKIFDESDHEYMREILIKIGNLEKKEMANYIGNFGNNFHDLARALMSKCVPVHYRLKPHLEKLFGQKLYYTTGYIRFNNENNKEIKTYHKMSLERAKECLETKILESNHHVWLTTQSLEIIDLTFGITLLMNDLKEFEEIINLHGFEPWMGIVAKEPSNLLNGMQYHPILIGDTFYKKVGLDLDVLSTSLYG